MPTIEDISRIAEIEFSDIVKTTSYVDFKMRIILMNNSFIDVHLSQKLPDRFGFHSKEDFERLYSMTDEVSKMI
ncbi:MAG: hypothetical protein E3K32_07360 [wastewater metagenome]|nr:hypothetical protein [Candidatus Loosdrechtia aerotolerans]